MITYVVTVDFGHEDWRLLDDRLPNGVFYDNQMEAVILNVSYDANLIVDGPSDCGSYRWGPGAGNAVRTGTGNGAAERGGGGYGHAIRDGVGDGNAVRNGNGDGDAVHLGSSFGHATRTGLGDGYAWRDGSGPGDAVLELYRYVSNPWSRVWRFGDGAGEAYLKNMMKDDEASSGRKTWARPRSIRERGVERVVWDDG